MVVFDRDGHFLTSWGEDVLADAHGIYIDHHDFIYCTERNTHCVRKFTRDGALLMTIGTPGAPGQQDGAPFNLPTDLDVAPNGDLYISDGYGNARVHRYSSTGELLHSWGTWGDQPGQFSLSHCVRIDRYERVWVCESRKQPHSDIRSGRQLPDPVAGSGQTGHHLLPPAGRRGLHRGAGAASQHLFL